MAEVSFTPLTPLNFRERAAAVFPQRDAVVAGDGRFQDRQHPVTLLLAAAEPFPQQPPRPLILSCRFARPPARRPGPPGQWPQQASTGSG